jgi:hypothetical protein
MMRDGGAIDWAKKHNSPFDYNKLALIDFVHSSKSAERTPLTLPNITIGPSRRTKYLGMMLDQNLKWNKQLAYVQEKVSKWAAQIRRATRPSWGLTINTESSPQAIRWGSTPYNSIQKERFCTCYRKA